MIIAAVCVGILLVLTGRRRRSVHRRQRLDGEYLDLLGVLVTGLEAGVHPMEAITLCSRGRDTTHVAARVAESWRRRERPLEDCLAILSAHFDAEPPSTSASQRGSQLAATLRAHLVDGQPLEATVETMIRDHDETCRRAAEAGVRELPIRLSPPLVLCILPSFMLACALPLAAMTRDSLVGTTAHTRFTLAEQTP